MIRVVRLGSPRAAGEVRRVKALHKKSGKALIARALLPAALQPLMPAVRDFKAALHIHVLEFGDVEDAQLEFAPETPDA